MDSNLPAARAAAARVQPPVVDARPRLRITRLRYRHPEGERALDIENVTIPLDTVTVICGRNGAGKSLMAMALSGLLPRAAMTIAHHTDSGTTAVLSVRQLQRLSGIVFQNSEHQIIGQTVEDDVSFGLKNLGLDGGEISTRVAEIMDICDIAALADRHPLSLSGGELRRVAIAAMIVMRPRMLILDEPFLSLDWQAQQTLSQMIVTVGKQGIAPVVVTHNLYAVHRYARWMVVIDRGAVVAEGAPRSVIDVAVGRRIVSGDVAAALPWL